MQYEYARTRKMLKLVLSILLLFLLAGCDTNNMETNDDLQTILPHIIPFSVKDYLPQAMKIAQKWHSDAYLLNLSIEVELPQVEWSENTITFGFQSPSNETKVLAVDCSGFCYSQELTTTISLPQCLPLEVNDSLLGSQEALNLGLANGGSDYVYNENAYVQLDLDRNYPRCDGSTITWEVQFGNMTTFKRVIFVFDAISGELLETR